MICDRGNINVVADKGIFTVTSVSAEIKDAVAATSRDIALEETAASTDTSSSRVGLVGSAPSKGDVLLRVNGETVPHEGLATLLARLAAQGQKLNSLEPSSSTFLPLVDTDTSKQDADGGRPLLGFLKIDFVRPDALVFEPHESRIAELQTELSKLLLDKERKRLKEEMGSREKETKEETRVEKAGKQRVASEKGEKERQSQLEAHQKTLVARNAVLHAQKEEAERGVKLKAKQEKDDKNAVIQKAETERLQKIAALDDGFDYIDSVHPKKGPLGLWFNPDPSIVPTMVTKDTGVVRIGDELVMVNNKDVVGMGIAGVVPEIQAATLPRTLKFRRLREPGKGGAGGKGGEETGGGGGDASGRMVLILRSPLIATHMMTYESAEFGTALSAMTPGTHTALLSMPQDACGGPLYGSEGMLARTNGNIVFARRGKCVFQDKAENLELGKAVLAVIINHKEDVIKMPAALGPKKVGIPAVMIGHRDGVMFELAEDRSATGVQVEVSSTSIYPDDSIDLLPLIRKQAADIKGGSLEAVHNAALLLWDGSDHYVYGGMSSDWLSDGSTLPKAAGGSALAKVVPSVPLNACGEFVKVRMLYAIALFLYPSTSVCSLPICLYMSVCSLPISFLDSRLYSTRCCKGATSYSSLLFTP